MGLAPGPAVGRIVKAVYERQLDGAVTDLESAQAAARAIIASGGGDAPQGLKPPGSTSGGEGCPV
jgi:hypothetical protein